MSQHLVYLVHFLRPYRHARHYMGTTGDLERRLDQHRRGTGARLMEVIRGAGIDFVLTRVWPGSRARERKLKRQGGHARKCPLCRALARRGG